MKRALLRFSKLSPLLALHGVESFVNDQDKLPQSVLDHVLNTVRSTYNDPIISLNYSMMRDENSSNMQFLQKYIELMDSVNDSNELNLLDIGCGTGATMSKTIYYILNEMENIKICNIIGVDIAETMLKVADQHLDFAFNEKHKNNVDIRKDMEINYKLIEGDMRNLYDVINNATNRDNKQLFDGIVSYYAIIHVPRQDHQRIFQQFWELLKNNGIICVCIGAEDLALDYGKWDDLPMYWSQFNMQTSLQLIEKCNFQIIQSKFIHDSTSDDPNCGHLFVLARKTQKS